MLKWLALLTVVMVLLLFGVGLNWDSSNSREFTHRYRLTVEIQVDGQTKVGSGVIEVVWHKAPFSFPWFSDVYGQGVFVDIEPYGGVVAALWPSGGSPGARAADTLAISALQYTDRGAGSFDLDPSSLNRISRIVTPTDLAPGNMPQLIWISDLEDPATARPVRSDEFSSVIGRNVHFKRAWVEITTDPVSTGLESKLPAFEKVNEIRKGRAIGHAPGKYTLDTYAIFGTPR